MHGATIKIPGITLSLRNTKQYNNLSYISFKIFPLLIYKLVPASVKLLDTLLEDVLLRPFQISLRILIDVSCFTRSCPCNTDFIRENW